MHLIRNLILLGILFSCNKKSVIKAAGEENRSDTSMNKNKAYEKNQALGFIEITYHSNGQIKSIEEQGIENSCGIFVGSHFYFDSLGNLEQQIVYETEQAENKGNCFDIVQIKSVYNFYKNGKLRSKYHFKNTYEGDDAKFGEWIKYDSTGKELSSTSY